jgi:hypothetical protein
MHVCYKQVEKFIEYFNYQLLRKKCTSWSKLKQLYYFQNKKLISRILYQFCGKWKLLAGAVGSK